MLSPVRRGASRSLIAFAGAWAWASTSGCALLDAVGGGDGARGGADDGEPGDGDDDSSVLPDPPTAVAGPDQVVPRGALVQLNGWESRGPDSFLPRYTWTLIVPDGSAATLVSPESEQPTFVADREGTYVATLVTTNYLNMTSAPDSVTITAENSPPIGHAGPDRPTYPGLAVTLLGDATDENGDPVTYRWTMLSSPPGSTASLNDSTTAAPTLIPDVEGEYQLQLVVSDGRLEGEPDVASVNSYPRLDLLEHPVLDAEYSRALDRIIMVTEAPNRLYIHNPQDGTERAVALPTHPTAVSVSSDGTHAAVGHAGRVSYVRLTDATLLATHWVNVNVFDLALASNGFAYAMPFSNQFTNMRCLDLTTGLVTVNTGGEIYPHARVKAHPGGGALYSAENDITPGDIEKFDIGRGTAELLYDSPYHGDHAMCGDLWISEDGLRIFTRCGNVFRAAPDRGSDMTYNGSLAVEGGIRHLDQAASANKVALIPDGDGLDPPYTDTSVRVYGYPFLGFERRFEIPGLLVADTFHPMHGRFVFISSDGRKLFVVAQVDEAAGLQNGVSVIAYELESSRAGAGTGD